MSQIKQDGHDLRDYWADHIKNWEKSGLSKKDYCRRHQLRYNRYIYWQRRIHSKTKQAFIPIRISGSIASGELRSVQAHCIIEYPQGIRLIIQSEAVLPMLPQLLKV